MRFILSTIALSVASAQVTSPSTGSATPNGNSDLGIFGTTNGNDVKQLMMPKNNQPIGSSDIGIMVSDNGTLGRKQVISNVLIPNLILPTDESKKTKEEGSEISNTTVASMLSRNRTVEKSRLRRFKDAKYMLVRRYNH